MKQMKVTQIDVVDRESGEIIPKKDKWRNEHNGPI